MKKLLSLTLLFFLFAFISNAQEDTSKIQSANEFVIYTVVDEMPQFPGGGEPALLDYLKKNTRYPASARENGETGTVYITFIIDKEGNVTDIKVLRGVSATIDAEALRVVSNMPSWIPGRNDGMPVKVQYNLPMRFSLAGKKSSSNKKKMKKKMNMY